MGDVLRKLALVLSLAAIALPAAAFDGPPQKGSAKKPAAQQEQSSADAGDDKSKTAAMVQQAFDGGIKAYGVGKYEEALRAFEAAMRGGLPGAQMPRALYYRGLTFRKLGKPGFAISDLTSALWLKGGLSEAERADAIKARALAYNESGISSVPDVPHSSYAEAPAMPGKSNDAQTAMASGGASPAAASNAPAAPTPPASSGGIGGFFTGLFGGGSSSGPAPEPAKDPASSTASIGRAPPPQAAEADGWGGTTEVVANNGADTQASRPPQIAEPFVTQVASVEPKTASNEPMSQSVPSGKFRLQVAAVRSRSEAEALAGLLVGRHGEQLGGRQPEVDESVIGSMGTFFRVRLGPYASAGEPEQLCGVLRSDGFDCLVVTQ